MTWCTFDPPYHGCATRTYMPLSDEDYAELIRLLLAAPFKWVMSEYLNQIYQPLTDKFGPPIQIPVIKHGTRPATNGKRPDAIECLWSNYDIRGMLCPEGTMDINNMIEKLEQKKRDIDVTIRTLRQEAGIKSSDGKASASTVPKPKKKGRAWTPEMREKMRAKIKASWASRRKGKKPPTKG